MQFTRITNQGANNQPTSAETLLTDLQEAVGGYIERVHLSGEYSGFYLIVNEEGLLTDNPEQNMFASAIAGQPIVGDCAIIKKEFFT